MKSILLSFFTIFLLIPVFHAQNSGLYGKKTFIEINGLGYSPMFPNFFNKSDSYYYRTFKVENGFLVEKKDRINYGFRVAIGRALKRNFAIGIEAGLDYFNLRTPYEHYYEYSNNWYYDYYYVKHENLDVKMTQIMPKLEFTKEGGLLPIGMNHQIGFGLNSFQVVDREYEHAVTDGQSNLTQEEIATIGKRFFNRDQKYKGYTVMYAFNIRTPITKNLLINYGIRYTLNLKSGKLSETDDIKYLYPSRQVASEIGRAQGFHFLTFNIGATFVF